MEIDKTKAWLEAIAKVETDDDDFFQNLSKAFENLTFAEVERINEMIEPANFRINLNEDHEYEVVRIESPNYPTNKQPQKIVSRHWD